MDRQTALNAWTGAYGQLCMRAANAITHGGLSREVVRLATQTKGIGVGAIAQDLKAHRKRANRALALLVKAGATWHTDRRGRTEAMTAASYHRECDMCNDTDLGTISELAKRGWKVHDAGKAGQLTLCGDCEKDMAMRRAEAKAKAA